MAFYKQDIVDVNLETGVIHRSFLNHTIGHKDDDADRFGIRAFRNGEPVDLSGAQCQAVFMAPDGQNIALTSYGTVSGNEAYVTLPQACYNVEGQFCLAIKLVGGGVTATVRIIDGVVDRTGATGAVAPTEAVPTYQEILAVYAEMQEDVADYESVVANQNDQINSLKSAFESYGTQNESYTGLIKLEWENGGLKNADATEQDGSAYKNALGRTGYIPVTPGDVIDFITPAGIGDSTFYIFPFTSDKTFTSLKSGAKYTVPSNVYFIRLRHNLLPTNGDLTQLDGFCMYKKSGKIIHDVETNAANIQKNADDIVALDANTQIEGGVVQAVTGAISLKWENGGINNTTGEDQDGDAYLAALGRTDYIPVTPGDVIYHVGNIDTWYICPYSSGKVYTSLQSGVTPYIVPQGVGYIRIKHNLPTTNGDLTQLVGFGLYRKAGVIPAEIDGVSGRVSEIEYNEKLNMAYRGWNTTFTDVTPMIPGVEYTIEASNVQHMSIIVSNMIPASGFVTMKGHVELTAHNEGTPTFSVAEILYDANGNYLGTGANYVSANDTDFDVTNDLNYTAVYREAAYVRMAVFGHNISGGLDGATIEFYDYARVSEYADLQTYAPKVADWLRNLNSAITAPQQSRMNYYTSPSGDRFLQQMNASGQLVTVNVIPDKALFIGNSLILGFDPYGMAATEAQYDYYNRICSAILEKNADFESTKMTGAAFEQFTNTTNAHNWITTNIIPLLDNTLDLVMIQLGDNVNADERRACFAESSLDLMRTIRTNAPNARVVWFGTWFGQNNIPAISANAKQTGVEFYSIADIRNEETQASMGQVYYTEDVTETEYTIDSFTTNGDGTMTILFTVSSVQYTTRLPYTSYVELSATSIKVTGHYKYITTNGVALHPGDEGFRQIANRLLYEMGIVDSTEYYQRSGE